MILARAVYWFTEFLEFAVLARAVMSWFVSNPYSGAGKIYGMLLQLTEPIVAPIRGLLYKNGGSRTGIDWSVFVAFILIDVVQGILLRILV